MGSPYIRASVSAMSAYVPGEMPERDDAAKLNQNENPYPPSPRVAEAVAGAVGALSRYPDSSSRALRETAGRLYGLPPEQVMATNGSDEFLRILFQACANEGDEVVAFYPSYTYYKTLAAIQHVKYRLVDFTDDYNIPSPLDLARAKLVFLPNPNAPSGTLFGRAVIDQLCQATKNGLVCIDEAYMDFAGAGSQIERFSSSNPPPNLVVARTLSKSHSLAGLRVGLGFASTELMAEFEKVRDYYNLDPLAQAAAVAALEDREYFQSTLAKITATRGRVLGELTGRGYFVWPSKANFLLMRLAHAAQAKEAYEALRRQGVYVRYFNAPRLADSLRISIGTDDEMDRFLAALDRCRPALPASAEK